MRFRVSTEQRKTRHLDICLNDDVASTLEAGFSAVRLRHEALPEIALEDVVLQTTFLGTTLHAPLIISSMTGGTKRAATINRNLAIAAQATGIALGLGSHSRRDRKPGALRDIRRARGRAEGDAVCEPRRGPAQLRRQRRRRAPRRQSHRRQRPLSTFKSAARIAAAARRHQLPWLASENRNARPRARRSGHRKKRSVPDLRRAPRSVCSTPASPRSTSPARAVRRAARVEGKRSEDPLRARLAEQFADWGVATAPATRAMRLAFPNATIVASGGVRSGVDVASARARRRPRGNGIAATRARDTLAGCGQRSARRDHRGITSRDVRNGLANDREPARGSAYSRGFGLIAIMPPSTRTSYVATPSISRIAMRPVSSEKHHACHGQVTVFSWIQPSASGPP